MCADTCCTALMLSCTSHHESQAKRVIHRRDSLSFFIETFFLSFCFFCSFIFSFVLRIFCTHFLDFFSKSFHFLNFTALKFLCHLSYSLHLFSFIHFFKKKLWELLCFFFTLFLYFNSFIVVLFHLVLNLCFFFAFIFSLCFFLTPFDFFLHFFHFAGEIMFFFAVFCFSFFLRKMLLLFRWFIFLHFFIFFTLCFSPFLLKKYDEVFFLQKKTSFVRFG